MAKHQNNPESKSRLELSTINHPWLQKCDQSIWLASSLRLIRNFENFCFPSKLELPKRLQVINLIEQHALPNKKNNPYSIIQAQSLTAHEKEFLHEHFLMQQSIAHAHQGEAFLIDKSGSFMATINIRNHLTLYQLDVDGDLENSWNKLTSFEESLQKNIAFAYSKKFGYLSADPQQCGTAFHVSLFLHLPALKFKEGLEDTIEQLKFDGIAVKSLHSDHSHFTGDIIVLENMRSLAVTEEDILRNLRTQSMKLIVAEKSLRSQFKITPPHSLKNQIHKAFGLVQYGYQLEMTEALDILSLWKLGIDLGWIEGVDHKTINKLLILLRKAHLNTFLSKNLDPEELKIERTLLLKKSLKKGKLIS